MPIKNRYISDTKGINSRIQRLMQVRGISTVYRLAQNTDITQQVLSKYFTEKISWGLDNLILVSQALGTSLDYLVFGKEFNQVNYVKELERANIENIESIKKLTEQNNGLKKAIRNLVESS